MKKSASLIALCLCVSFLICLQYAIPWFIKRKILQAPSAECEHCFIELKSVKLAWFPARLIFNDFVFLFGDRAATRVEIRSPLVEAHFSVVRLFTGNVFVPLIKFDHPNVAVVEGNLRLKIDPDSTSDRQSFVRHFSTISINNATFTYNREYKSKSARIHLADINGTIQVDKEDIDANLSGEIEKFGAFSLILSVPQTLSNIDLDANIVISNQKLSRLNSYFLLADGVSIEGHLLRGESWIAIRGDALNCRVRAEYSGLDIQFQKTKLRSAVSAFFLNLGESLTVDSSSLDRKSKEQTRTINLKRYKDEPIFHFIFRGAAAAALAVAT